MSWSPQGRRIAGVMRVNTALRAGSQSAAPGTPLGELASRDFTIVRADDVAFDVIRRMWRKRAIMALVVADRPATGRHRSGRHHQGACRRLGSRQH